MNIFTFLLDDLLGKECEICGEKSRSVSGRKKLCRSCYEKVQIEKAEAFARAKGNPRRKKYARYDEDY